MEDTERMRLAKLHDYPLPEEWEVRSVPVFDYQVHELTPGHWEAWTPYRAIYYCGSSEKEAVGRMLADMARLAWLGALDSRYPDRPASSASRMEQIKKIAEYDQHSSAGRIETSTKKGKSDS